VAKYFEDAFSRAACPQDIALLIEIVSKIQARNLFVKENLRLFPCLKPAACPAGNASAKKPTNRPLRDRLPKTSTHGFGIDLLNQYKIPLTYFPTVQYGVYMAHYYRLRRCGEGIFSSVGAMMKKAHRIFSRKA
jgi:hypothetical protein